MHDVIKYFVTSSQKCHHASVMARRFPLIYKYIVLSGDRISPSPAANNYITYVAQLIKQDIIKILQRAAFGR